MFCSTRYVKVSVLSFALAVSFVQSTERTPWILSKIFSAGAYDLLSLVSFTVLREHESSYFRLVISTY